MSESTTFALSELAGKYVIARQSGNKADMLELLTEDCISTLNNLEHGPDQVWAIRDWVEPKFTEEKHLTEAFETENRIVLCWDVQVWDRTELDDTTRTTQKTIAIEFLEVRDGRISRRWMAFDASYHMKHQGW